MLKPQARLRFVAINNCTLRNQIPFDIARQGWAHHLTSDIKFWIYRQQTQFHRQYYYLDYSHCNEATLFANFVAHRIRYRRVCLLTKYESLWEIFTRAILIKRDREMDINSTSVSYLSAAYTWQAICYKIFTYTGCCSPTRFVGSFNDIVSCQ